MALCSSCRKRMVLIVKLEAINSNKKGRLDQDGRGQGIWQKHPSQSQTPTKSLESIEIVVPCERELSTETTNELSIEICEYEKRLHFLHMGQDTSFTWVKIIVVFRSSTPITLEGIAYTRYFTKGQSNSQFSSLA